MRKGEKTRLAIIEAAASLFLDKGYEATTIEDILDRLKISKGSFYYHFETKMDLLSQFALSRVQESHKAYLHQPPYDLLDRFNHLLKHLSPLRKEEVSLLSSLIQLSEKQEGVQLFDAFQRAATSLFFEEFVYLVNQLSLQDLAENDSEPALALAFSNFMNACHLQIMRAATLPLEQFKSSAPLLLRAQRKQLEESLGLLPGSVLAMQAEAMMEAILLATKSRQ